MTLVIVAPVNVAGVRSDSLRRFIGNCTPGDEQVQTQILEKPCREHRQCLGCKTTAATIGKQPVSNERSPATSIDVCDADLPHHDSVFDNDQVEGKPVGDAVVVTVQPYTRSLGAGIARHRIPASDLGIAPGVHQLVRIIGVPWSK